MELYDQISNPIDDPEVLEKLINAYANSSEGFGGYYNQLVKTVPKERGSYNQRDHDKFYSMLFNKWKNNIVAMTKDEFIELYRRGSYGQDFRKMRTYLKKVPDASTWQETLDIVHGDKNDKELEQALDKYIWTSFGRGPGWTHVASRYLTAKKEERINVEHRLYLNTDSADTLKMARYLVEKCDEHKLPYYFKYDPFENRDDTIVIYSSSENLTKYIEVLREIKKENPDLASRIKQPPILTGKIDGWIGYGSEPAKTADGRNTSFNAVRANLLEKSIETVTKQWIMDNRNLQITYQGQKLSFQDYLAMKSTEKLINDLERRYLFREENDKKIAEENRETYNPSIVNDRLGYTLHDVKNPQFKENIYKILKDRIPALLDKIQSGSYQDIKAINMNVRNDKQIKFAYSDLEVVIQKLSIKISKNDPKFMNAVQTKIKNNAIRYGIDKNNFCFDIKAREKLRVVAVPKEAERQEVAQIESKLKQSIESETEKTIDRGSLDVQSFSQIINPELMKRKMKLPNGAEISAKQYIEEIVYPQLPQNGIVISDNFSILTAKQFVEEGVIFECQEKYNGDFPKYMAERTRNNLGVVSINNNEESFEINPLEIVEGINPVLLEKRKNLPNGAEISAKQYIEEIYAPHIPASGRVILSNGVDVSAKQYIEEKLLAEDQEKYNGDIGQILYNTTRSNKGTINMEPQKLQETLLGMIEQIDSLNNNYSSKQRR